MNTQQLDEYCERRGLSAKARQVIDHVRSSPPSRLVQSGTKNVACRFASRKMGQVIQAESHQNELAAVIGWEHDKNTHEFYDQPPKIKLRYVDRNGRASAHLKTTDFFLLQEDFTGWVECKTEDWLEARVKTGVGLYVKDEVAGWRCPPGEEYAAEFGMGFKVRSSSATEWIAIRNLQFLSDYLDERCPPPSAQSMARVHAEFSERPWIALKDLLDRIPTSDADTVFKMIADNILFFRMEDNLLTEPERTLIFHTRVAMEAYRCHLDSQAEPTLPSLRTLTVAPGQSMLWDGRVWRILNVGDEDIFIEDSENVITSLRRESFEQLVKDGVITGLPTGTVTVRNQAEELVRRTSPRDLEGAMQRYRCLFPGHFDEPAPKSCSRARRKWRAMYKRGQELYGSGLLGLIPRTSQRGNRLPRIDEAVVTVMEKVIDELYATNSGWSMVACWGEVCNRCNARSLLAPSLAAFRKQIRLRGKTEVVTAREGEKAAYSSSEFFWRLDASTPRHGERPFEIGHIDHTELDLQFRGSRRGEKLGKAWLSVLIDAWSRQVLAWIITFDPPSYRSCMLLLRECIVRHGRIPKTIVVDKGPDLQSVYLDTLLARLESHKKTRPGSRPRFGSVIERFFGVSNQQFTHCLQGNNLALQKPRQMSESHDPRELSVWDPSDVPGGLRDLSQRCLWRNGTPGAWSLSQGGTGDRSGAVRVSTTRPHPEHHRSHHHVPAVDSERHGKNRFEPRHQDQLHLLLDAGISRPEACRNRSTGSIRPERQVGRDRLAQGSLGALPVRVCQCFSRTHGKGNRPHHAGNHCEEQAHRHTPNDQRIAHCPTPDQCARDGKSPAATPQGPGNASRAATGGAIPSAGRTSISDRRCGRQHLAQPRKLYLR
jgi:putative transposase